MKPVPMNQICLENDCRQPAKFEKEGMYYCAECFKKSIIAFADNDLIVYVLTNAIAQINYLSRRLSAKEFTFTRPTTNEAINKINEVIKLIKEKK